MHISYKGNAFAILQEEKQVFRRKEKREKGPSKKEQHRARDVEHVVPQKDQVPERLPETSVAVKWADMKDDDEDELPPMSMANAEVECNRDNHSSDDEHVQEDPLDEENLDDDDLENDEAEASRHVSLLNVEPTSPLTTENKKDILSSVRTEKHAINYRLLSKKERQKVQAQELEELDILLSRMGVGGSKKGVTSSENAAQTILSKESPDQTDTQETWSNTAGDRCKETSADAADPLQGPGNSNASDHAGSKSRAKKHKKNLTPVSGAAPTEAPAASIPTTVPRKDVLSAVRKAVGARKKHHSSNPGNVIVESAKAEAKKKSELKKAKQKKEKRFLER